MSTLDEAMKQAEAALAAGDHERAIHMVGLALTIDPHAQIAYDAAARALEGRADANDQAGLLFRLCHDNFEDPRYFYKLGFAFVQADAPHLAQPILRRAFELAPDHPNVRVEYGVALAETGRHGEAARVLAQLDPATIARNPAVRFLRGWCALLSGAIDEATGLLAELGTDVAPDLRERLELGVARIRRLGAPATDDLTGWHFVQYGSGLLTTSDAAGMGGRFGVLPEARAETAARLAAMLDLLSRCKRQITHVVGPTDRDSEVLGRAIAEHLGVPYAGFVEHAAVHDGTLFCAATAEQLGHIPYLRPRTQSNVVYAHTITWTRSAPYVPDIAGLIAQGYFAPWRRAMRSDQDSAHAIERGEDPRAAEEIAVELARLIREVPTPAVPPALIDHADLSLYAGTEAVTTRPPFRQESPVPAKRFL